MQHESKAVLSLTMYTKVRTRRVAVAATMAFHPVLVLTIIQMIPYAISPLFGFLSNLPRAAIYPQSLVLSNYSQASKQATPTLAGVILPFLLCPYTGPDNRLLSLRAVTFCHGNKPD